MLENKLLALYEGISREFYENCLPHITITISYTEKQVKWSLHCNDDNTYRLYVNLKLLNCEENELYMNMLHQTTHIYNHMRGIVDCIQNYRYHNYNWDIEARRVGLITGTCNLGYKAVDIEDDTVRRIKTFFDYGDYKKTVIETIEKSKDKPKLTSLHITEQLSDDLLYVLNNAKMKRVNLHRDAIDAFINSEKKVDEVLKITNQNDPRYLKKPKLERIYLDRIRRTELENIAKEQNVGITTILFQALKDYCAEYMRLNG